MWRVSSLRPRGFLFAPLLFDGLFVSPWTPGRLCYTLGQNSLQNGFVSCLIQLWAAGGLRLPLDPFCQTARHGGFVGGIEPLTLWHRKIPQAPGVCSLPLPGSAGSLRRPRPLSLEVVSEAGVWVLGAPGSRGVVACRASQRTACARTHKPLCVERLCPGDTDREVAPAPLALPRQSPGAWLRCHPRPQWGPRLPAPTAPLRCRLSSVGSGRPPRAPWETTHGCRGPGLVRVASTRSSFPAPSAGSGMLDRPPCSGSHAEASGNVLG